jgi:hypothetical protein
VPDAGTSPNPSLDDIIVHIKALRKKIGALDGAQRAALESSISQQFGLHIDSLMHGDGSQGGGPKPPPPPPPLGP